VRTGPGPFGSLPYFTTSTPCQHAIMLLPKPATRRRTPFAPGASPPPSSPTLFPFAIWTECPPSSPFFPPQELQSSVLSPHLVASVSRHSSASFSKLSPPRRARTHSVAFPCNFASTVRQSATTPPSPLLPKAPLPPASCSEPHAPDLQNGTATAPFCSWWPPGAAGRPGHHLGPVSSHAWPALWRRKST
jgi:hypothetical protein